MSLCGVLPHWYWHPAGHGQQGVQQGVSVFSGSRVLCIPRWVWVARGSVRSMSTAPGLWWSTPLVGTSEIYYITLLLLSLPRQPGLLCLMLLAPCDHHIQPVSVWLVLLMVSCNILHTISVSSGPLAMPASSWHLLQIGFSEVCGAQDCDEDEQGDRFGGGGSVGGEETSRVET